MKLQNDTLLGLVFFGGLVMLGWATFNLTDLSFEEKPTTVVYFNNAQGLRDGDPVFILGTRSGRVKEVALSQEADRPPIRVLLELDAPMPELAPDHTIEIRQANLLGGSQVDIDPGAGTPATVEPPLQGQLRPSALDSIGQADIAGTASSIRRFFDRLLDPTNSVGALLNDRTPFDDLAAALRSFRNIAGEVESGTGPLHELVHSEEMAEDLAGTVREIREVVHKINEGTGLLARLVNDGELGADVATILSDVRTVTGGIRRGEGMAGRILADERTARAFDDIVASLRSVAIKLDDPNAGFLAGLIGDPLMAEQGRELIANLSATARALNSDQGLLGKLINDPEMGEKLDRLFDQVAGAVEDAREAAPVGTLFQVLAGPF